MVVFDLSVMKIKIKKWLIYAICVSYHILVIEPL